MIAHLRQDVAFAWFNVGLAYMLPQPAPNALIFSKILKLGVRAILCPEDGYANIGPIRANVNDQ